MDLDNRIEMCLLLDFYGPMLTEKQQNIMHKYFELDISLVEIGEDEHISRQAVRDALKTAQKVLVSCEEKLGFVSRFRVLKNLTNEIIEDVKADVDRDDLIDKLNKLSKIL